MALNTPILGISYPQLGDSPNAPANFVSLANGLDPYLLPRFVDNTARDAAIPSPTVGQMCVNGTTSGVGQSLQIYRDGAWQLVAQPKYVYKTADTARSLTTTLTADPHLAVSLFTGVYVCEFVGTYSCAVDTVDAKFKVGISTGTLTISEMWQGAPTTVTSASSAAFLTLNNVGSPTLQFDVGTVASSVPLGICNAFYLSVTTGSVFTLSIDWAQVNSSANAVTLHAGSYLKYTRIG